MSTRARRQPQARNEHPIDPPPPPPPPTHFYTFARRAFTIIVTFLLLLNLASDLSARFAHHAARPLYASYPAPVATGIIGAVCATICYAPTTLAIAAFLLAFRTDIRQRGGGAALDPPPGARTDWRRVARSLFADAAVVVKVAAVVSPALAYALGHGAGSAPPQVRAAEARAGGQLAAAGMTLKILVVASGEMWDLLPVAALTFDRARVVRERGREERGGGGRDRGSAGWRRGWIANGLGGSVVPMEGSCSTS
ncbi:uncharacterized protein BXZ73DRAFT_80007 [Epithele typhae]|uniref:uncharacterized protein n=1 Tax=Epithele typhae TaxID=378194 RepID=UPI002007FAD0|nr:uncharacterized protein BXZ73DRAFT_80007 [Epithele typhae]KAH9921237.1 hypothetical protein BXZ73DRAFT_80007 [Epithele typhae]